MPGGSKKKWHIALYAFGMLIFACWLIFSTTIITNLFGNKIKKVDFAKYSPFLFRETSYVCLVSGMDFITYNEDYLQTLYISGWACIETTEDNSNRVTTLLINDAQNKHCYELYPTVVPRADINKNLPRLQKKEKMSFPNPNMGITGKFSLLNVTDGTYDIYAYIWENDINYSLADTGYQIKKSGDDVQISPWSSERCETALEPTNIAEGYLDSVSLDDSLLQLYGWTLIEDKDCRSQTVSVELMDDNGEKLLYTTKPAVREDVVTAYGNELYRQSGWQAAIPIEELTQSSYFVNSLVENEGETQKGKRYALIIDNNEASIHWCSDTPPDTLAATETEQTTGCLDSVSMAGGYLSLWGWELIPGQNSANQKVYVEIQSAADEKRQYTTLSTTRKDVSEKYNDTMYEDSGWSAFVPASDFEDGQYTVRMFVKNGTGIWQSQAYSFTLENGVCTDVSFMK